MTKKLKVLIADRKRVRLKQLAKDRKRVTNQIRLRQTSVMAVVRKASPKLYEQLTSAAVIASTKTKKRRAQA